MKKICVACIFILTAGSVFAQDKMLYVGGSGGLGPIFGPNGTTLGGNVSPLQIDWQITSFLSLGTGLNFYFGPQTKQYNAPNPVNPEVIEMHSGMETHIVFPLILEATYRPGRFSFEIGGGAYVAPVVMMTMVERTNENGYATSEAFGKNYFSASRSNPFGFIVTGSFGVKIGQGILFFDVNYLQDFAETIVKFRGTQVGSHDWNILVFNIGFKYGILHL